LEYLIGIFDDSKVITGMGWTALVVNFVTFVSKAVYPWVIVEI